MNRILVAAMLAAVACSTESRSFPGAMFVAEGRHHFAIMTAYRCAEADEENEYAAAIRPALDVLRDARGNLSVYVLRTAVDGSVELTVLSEWKSSDDVRRCQGNAKCAAAMPASSRHEFEVLFEATQIDPISETMVRSGPGRFSSELVTRRTASLPAPSR